jgi:hypothetical protein
MCCRRSGEKENENGAACSKSAESAPYPLSLSFQFFLLFTFYFLLWAAFPHYFPIHTPEMSPGAKFAYTYRMFLRYSKFFGNLSVLCFLSPAHPTDANDLLPAELGASIVFTITGVRLGDIEGMQHIFLWSHCFQVGNRVVCPVAVNMIDLQAIRNIAVMMNVDDTMMQKNITHPSVEIPYPNVAIHHFGAFDPARESLDGIPRLLDPDIPLLVDGIIALRNQLEKQLLSRTHTALPCLEKHSCGGALCL